MKPQGYGCGLEAPLAVVGGKWKPIVLWNLGRGPGGSVSFGGWWTGISEKMLIQQLREMEADGIVARRDFQEIPPRVEYSLTEFGVSLAQALKPLCDWGREHKERIAGIKGRLTRRLVQSDKAPVTSRRSPVAALVGGRVPVLRPARPLGSYGDASAASSSVQHRQVVALLGGGQAPPPPGGSAG